MPVVPLVTGADVVVVAAGVSVVCGEVVADSTLYGDQYGLARYVQPLRDDLLC